MIEFGIRVASGRVIVGPGWSCVADVVGSVHYHGVPYAKDHGELVSRESVDAPWFGFVMPEAMHP